MCIRDSFYNYLDLTIRNDTPDTWRLMLRVTDTHLEGEWRCSAPQTLRYEVYEKEHYFQGEYWLSLIHIWTSPPTTWACRAAPCPTSTLPVWWTPER